MSKQEDFFSVEDEKDEYSMVLDQMFKKEKAPVEENSSSPESKKKEKKAPSKKKGKISSDLSEHSDDLAPYTIYLSKKEAITMSILSSMSKKSVSSLVRRAIHSSYSRYFADTEKYSEFLEFYDINKINLGNEEDV